MRFLLNVTFPHEPFNAAVRDGSAGAKIKSILDHTKPEAVYFTEQHGERSAILIVAIDDVSQIPSLSEPWFLTFSADVEWKVIMSPEDLAKGHLDDLGKKWA